VSNPTNLYAVETFDAHADWSTPAQLQLKARWQNAVDTLLSASVPPVFEEAHAAKASVMAARKKNRVVCVFMSVLQGALLRSSAMCRALSD
jgi:hypothetical protein